jgi:hypothetical protein
VQNAILVIAGPSVWEPAIRRPAIALQIVSTSLGSLGLAIFVAGVAALFGHLPLWVVGISALTVAVVAIVKPTWKPFSSTWMIPQGWARAGPIAYSSIFGALLGFAIVTRLPGAAFYVLLAYGLSSSQLLMVAIPFVTFALARAVPYSAIGLLRKSNHGFLSNMNRISHLSKHARTWEMVALGLMAVPALGPCPVKWCTTSTTSSTD